MVEGENWMNDDSIFNDVMIGGRRKLTRPNEKLTPNSEML